MKRKPHDGKARAWSMTEQVAAPTPAPPRLVSSNERLRELDRQEGRILRGIALDLVAANKRNDWGPVLDIARHLAKVALVKDPPDDEVDG